MSANKTARKTLTVIFTIGATMAIGFLSFAGMFVLSSSLIWCGTAFVLAAAYEGQVNAEGISSALRRMFDKNYLKRGILNQYLESQLEEEDERIKKIYLLELEKLKDSTEEEREQLKAQIEERELAKQQNGFLKDYRKQKKYLEDFEKIEHLTEIQIKEKAAAKKQLRLMESVFFKQFEDYDNHDYYLTPVERSARELMAKDREKILTEINRKKWLIRASWLFALGGGVSSGLAAFSAIKTGVAAFAILSAIPGGALIALAGFAAVGYTLLLYQSISDMVQEYQGKWRTYFTKRDNESTLKHVVRCTATVLAIGIAIVATVATAGTWWYAAKEGATLLKIADRAADILRSVSVALMALPAFIFSTSNSIASIDDMSKSSYGKLITDAKTSVKDTWKAESFFRFINPFRFVEKVITYTAKSVLFLGHVISMGFISDRFDAMPAPVCIAANSTGEVLTDLNYLPDEKKDHGHESKLLSILFFPVNVVVKSLKLLSVLWDWPFSGSLKKSYDHMFPSPQTQKSPEKPVLSEEWRKQQVIEVCDKTITRLKDKSPEKVMAAKKIKATIREEGDLEEKEPLLRQEAQPLAKNRLSFWKQKTTKSQSDMDAAFDELIVKNHHNEPQQPSLQFAH